MAFSSSRNTSRSKPAAVAVSKSSSVYDTSGPVSHRGAGCPAPPHIRTQLRGGLAGGGKPAMSSITCRAAETARSTAASRYPVCRKAGPAL
jgi:hypothetical protein